MRNKATYTRSLRRLLLWCVGMAVVGGFGAPGSAFAQQAAQANSGGTANIAVSNTLQPIVVTSTRVDRKGYKAPTPTTVLGFQDIEAAAKPNIADFLNELPSVAGSATPLTKVAFVSAGLTGINAINLRNLGQNRTLVLLDGQRVGPSTITGWVDVNEFPQALIKRIDVVTGGASADWGSDAVAGVVNFVLDKNFTGLKAEADAGVTNYGDDGNYTASLTGGTGFLNNRGHLLFSVEDDYNEGIPGVPRNWYNGSKLIFNPTYTATNGQPQLLVAPGTGFATATPGGIITSGPLKGTYFGPGGTPSQFAYGSLVSGNFMQGGDWQYADFAKSGDLDPRLSRQNLFLRASYDVTDHVQVFAQTSYGLAASHEAALDQFNFANITIQPDNAFIPSTIADKVAGPFTMGSFNQDLGPIIAVSRRSSLRPVIGANGDFDAFGSNWSWDVYGQESINNIYTSAQVSITSNFNRAIDSVRNANGAVVCRSTLANPANGCVPYDVFGTGVNSTAALNYVLGTAWGRTRLTEQVAAANLHGNPISDWAGPISVATGVEHRREAVSGSNDPLSSEHAYFAGNYTSSFGSYSVTEGYVETVVPLARNQVFAKTLDFDGAARATSYSTSGYVTTWKLGLTYTPVSDIMFRASRSRDIRAPNLSELFQAGQASTHAFVDPFNGNAIETGFQITQGNTNLKPEVANTTDIGIVLQPRFIRGFSGSVDYYNIDINQAISTVNGDTIVSQCFAGDAALCPQIIRNSSGVISEVLVEPVNLAKQIARGVDFEVDYRHSLAEIAPWVGGEFNVRLLATHFLKNYLNNGINAPTDNVGTDSDNGTAGLSLPRWRYLATLGWARGPAVLTLTARGFSAGVYNTSYIQCSSACPPSTATNMTINSNGLPGAIYFDANISYDFTDHVEMFLSVNNVADKPPVQVAYGPSIGAAPLSVNPALYDVLGRTFRVGFRFQM